MKRVASTFAFLFIAGIAAMSVYAQSSAASALQSGRPSDYVNDHLPSWLRLNGEYRMRFEGIDGIAFGFAEDAFVLSRLRVNTTLSPLSWLRVSVQGQDAQVAARNGSPDGPPFEDTFDLRQAYVEFGNIESNRFGLRIGRQEMVFGEQRLLGHVAWANTARSFDAVRASYRDSFLRIDVFAASVVNIREGEFNKRTDANNIHGVYAVLRSLVPNGSVEPYVFWRLARGMRSETGALAKLDSKTIGVRWAGKLPAGFDYSMEAAAQTGSAGADAVRAWAGHWTAGYTVSAPYAPRVIAEYNYASGDRDSTDGRQEAFDQLYPTGHDKYGLADQVGWKNIHDLRWGIELKPASRLAVSGGHHSWWLASTRDGLYNAGGVMLARSADGSAGRHVGQELAVQTAYTMNSQIQISGGYARIFPGTFLQRTTPGRPHHFSFAMVSYLF